MPLTLPAMHRILVALAGGLILYGSLYPFGLQTPSAEDWQRLWQWRGFWSSPGDMLGNVALFLPWGLTCMRAWRSRHGCSLTLWLGASSGLVLAVLAQVGQLAVPVRDPALVDVFWNMIGCSLGLALGLAWPAPVNAATGASRQLQPLLLVLACAVAEWLPLVPSLDWALVKAQLRSLQDAPMGTVSTMADHALLQLVLGWALAVWFSGWRLAFAQLVALLLTVAGKLVQVKTQLDGDLVVGAVVGTTLSLSLHVAGRHADRSWSSAAMVWTCLALVSISALSPGVLRESMAAFNWVPLAGLLQGDMLQNSRELVMNLAVFAGMVMAAQACGAGLRGFSLSLAAWMLLLELAQCWIDPRTGDITTPLLVLMSGLLVAATGRGGKARGAAPVARVLTKAPTAAVASQAPVRYRDWRRHPAGTMVILLLPLVLTMHLGLRLPELPYNVRELFLADGHVVVLAVFSLALLWLGAGPAWLGRLLAESARPWLWLPIGALSCASVSLAMLSLSTTAESLDDIAGSNNLYWFVTNKDLWGAWWRDAFLRLDAPGLVGFFERIVRWAALYGPLPITLGMLVALSQLAPGRRASASWRVGLVASGALMLWLCKAIAFDWSSTDNLNELIAPDGPWGWGGGGWLFALLVVVCCNALLLANAIARRWPARFGAAAATLAALPAGWWLLNAGLDPAVQKYGQVFSGAQFLLGPDRQHLMPELVLQLRWFAVQLGVVVTLAAGIRLERRFADWRAASRPVGQAP